MPHPGGHLLGKVLLAYRVSDLAFGGLVKNGLFILASRRLFAAVYM
jgi:sugar lactone lactonase YvrE